jgi:hypothetical protein
LTGLTGFTIIFAFFAQHRKTKDKKMERERTEKKEGTNNKTNGSKKRDSGGTRDGMRKKK